MAAHTLDLSSYGITVSSVKRNPCPAKLYEHGILFDRGDALSDTGALIAYSGAKTGRSPKDKRVVEHPDSKDDIWWGDVNIPLSPESFGHNRARAIKYLNSCPRLYVIDAYAGWDPAQRLKVRVVCSRPYHALFMWTMLIRPTEEELDSFGDPDFTIFNAGPQGADPEHVEGVTSQTSVALSFEDAEAVILGTEYAGEMKKGVFTLMNYLMPKKGLLSMHCSATADPETNSSVVLFGLSGTGKTTLSADPKRKLVGDDEHVWTDTGVFNIEGGCYAKTINLTEQSEPDIYRALKFGAVLENVVYDRDSHAVDYTDVSITENTRGAYPIDSIPNAQIPCIAGHPTQIIFLTCDAFGVLPPVAKLTPEQAMVHFISGYTAKVAGTEVGVTEPQVTFSACFGAPFLAWHPAKYAELLAANMQKHDVGVYLVNTGWAGGAYGTGSRISLKYSRAIVDAINTGNLRDAPTQTDPVFKFETVTQVPGVPDDILVPRNTWADQDAYDATATKLAGLFEANFQKYADGVSPEVQAACPG